MRRIRSALYLDFDNIVSGLLEADPRAAMAWLDDPGILVDRLGALDEATGVTRDLLVRRAYLNPNGWVPDPSAPDAENAERLPLAQYRIALTKAGFEVVDCPTLAKGQKNAADIRMVIDVLDAIAGPVPYDEVIIASNDADFTPLLVKLRASDRRTTILTTGDPAAAYCAVADRRIDETQLVALLSPALALVPEARPVAKAKPKATVTAKPEPEPKPKPVAKAKPNPVAKAKPASTPSGPERHAASTLAALVTKSSEPVALVAASSAIRGAVGTDHVNDTNWFGHGSLTQFVKERATDFRIDQASVWDPAHQPEKPGS